MALGKLTEYKKIADPSNRNDPLNSPSKRGNLIIKLSSSIGATNYFMQVNDVVYYREDPDLDANILISCKNEFNNIVPKGAKFKAFKTGERFHVGYISLNPSTKELKFISALEDEDSVVKNGLTYEHVGEYQSKTIYARLDRAAITKLHSGSHLSDRVFQAYETSMRKRVIPSGSTGSDGIKYDHKEWVIKLTISIAQHIGTYNEISPMATVLTEGNNIYLNFNQLTKRH